MDAIWLFSFLENLLPTFPGQELQVNDLSILNGGTFLPRISGARIDGIDAELSSKRYHSSKATEVKPMIGHEDKFNNKKIFWRFQDRIGFKDFNLVANFQITPNSNGILNMEMVP